MSAQGGRMGWLAGLLLLLGGVAILSRFLPGDPPPAPRETLTLGVAVQPSSALIMVALEQGFFAAEGLDVEVTGYPSGKRALQDGLFTGAVEVATSSEIPAMMAALEGRPVKFLAATFRADNVNRVIARRDAGIQRPADLRGKRLATQKASAVHYFLHLFLLQNRIREDAVSLSFLKAEELPGALARGEIDAFAMREPYISQAAALLGDNAVVFEEPGIYRQVDVLLVSQTLLQRRPRVAERVLRALLAAERFAAAAPDAAMAITARRLGVDAGRIREEWPTFQLGLFLDHGTLLLLESQGRWAMARGMGGGQGLPDMNAMIHSGPLFRLHPEAVTLIQVTP